MSAAVRLLGAALVAFSGWAAGWWLTEKKRRRLAALEQLERLLPGHFVSSLQIGYLHECRPEEVLELYTAPADGGWFVRGVGEDGTARFDASLHLSPLP